jgi:hypothetical protein
MEDVAVLAAHCEKYALGYSVAVLFHHKTLGRWFIPELAAQSASEACLKGCGTGGACVLHRRWQAGDWL